MLHRALKKSARGHKIKTQSVKVEDIELQGEDEAGYPVRIPARKTTVINDVVYYPPNPSTLLATVKAMERGAWNDPRESAPDPNKKPGVAGLQINIDADTLALAGYTANDAKPDNGATDEGDGAAG
jgi:hypothetical protein